MEKTNEYNDLLSRLCDLEDERELLRMSGVLTPEITLEMELEIDGIEDRLAVLQKG